MSGGRSKAGITGKANKVRIADLPNFGPKSQIMLEQAGIGTVAQLRELGAVRAYLRVKRQNGRASLNLLWALEGALSGRHWLEVAKHDRLRLLLEIEETQAQHAADTTLSGRGA